MTETRDPVEVHVTGADQKEAARLLLKAAEDTGHPVDSVATIAGGFLVPYDVAVKAGALADDDEEEDAPALEITEATETELEAHPEVTGTEETAGTEEELAVVVTSDGVEHVGVLPASAAVPPATDAAVPTERTGEGDQVLRGEALEAALKERSLPTSGSADEKRARVAEYDAAAASSQQ